MNEAPTFGTLYLIPTPLDGQDLNQAITLHVQEVVRDLKHFIVENSKSARKFLKLIETRLPLQQLVLTELNEHTPESHIQELLLPLEQGTSVGLLSEAGMPCLADPGSSLVAAAHHRGIVVVPLVGPSSVLLAIIGSGLNGQNFCFCGYLPARSPEREEKIRELQNRSRRSKQSQFFIETPYRAEHLMASLLAECDSQTRLSLGINLGSPEAVTLTQTIGEWISNPLPIKDKLVVFGIQA